MFVQKKDSVVGVAKCENYECGTLKWWQSGLVDFPFCNRHYPLPVFVLKSATRVGAVVFTATEPR